MEELTSLLAKIELTADDIIDAKQQIVDLDAKRHKIREATGYLRDLQRNSKQGSNLQQRRHWVCVGDMFIRLDGNQTKNLIIEDQYHIDEGVEKLRDQLKEKVAKLRELEGKPEITGFNLKPLKKEEIVALRTAFKYLVKSPDYFIVGEHPNGDMMAYIMGKVEGDGEDWHGHVTALSVASIYRRTNLAAKLMTELENVSERKQAYFVDLFVRQSNHVAVTMYERLGYSVYRRVLDYYSGDPDEDALDMRKALSRDVHKRSIKPLSHPVRACDV